MNNTYIYIGIMFLVTFLIRVLPLTVIRKKIKNVTLRSFLFYVPYITLAVMTFPAIIETTDSLLAGLISFVIGIILAYLNVSLFGVAVSCCAIVFVCEFIINLL